MGDVLTQKEIDDLLNEVHEDISEFPSSFDVIPESYESKRTNKDSGKSGKIGPPGTVYKVPAGDFAIRCKKCGLSSFGNMIKCRQCGSASPKKKNDGLF